MGDARWRWGAEFDVCVRELHLSTLEVWPETPILPKPSFS